MSPASDHEWTPGCVNWGCNRSGHWPTFCFSRRRSKQKSSTPSCCRVASLSNPGVNPAIRGSCGYRSAAARTTTCSWTPWRRVWPRFVNYLFEKSHEPLSRDTPGALPKGQKLCAGKDTQQAMESGRHDSLGKPIGDRTGDVTDDGQPRLAGIDRRRPTDAHLGGGDVYRRGQAAVQPADDFQHRG